MIRSMTAFGSARAESAQGSVTIEFRTVNSRFLDINFRLPEDLRMVEGLIREKLVQVVTRGKVEIRLNYTHSSTRNDASLDLELLANIASQLQAARQVIPDTPAPSFNDLLSRSNNTESPVFDSEIWTAMCQEAATLALSELQAAREREGQRLGSMMQECSKGISAIVDQVEKELPALLSEHQEKISNKLRDTLMAVSPEGFEQISGAELSARIAQESSLFSLRIDVAEELSRLRSHTAELEHLLSTGESANSKGKKSSGSAGKRLDFLFQEMNREANTLGSKASALSITHAAINLKLLIEQMREQAQNIE
ncbi:YicC family protein [Alcaligenaceae bacterium]|nr:YicC family protein [Alcaligenaceae bacterium]